MSATLRVHGTAWAIFDVQASALGKTVTLWMHRDKQIIPLLEMTVVNDRLLYSTVNDKPVLGGTTFEGGTEHVPVKDAS